VKDGGKKGNFLADKVEFETVRIEPGHPGISLAGFPVISQLLGADSHPVRGGTAYIASGIIRNYFFILPQGLFVFSLGKAGIPDGALGPGSLGAGRISGEEPAKLGDRFLIFTLGKLRKTAPVLSLGSQRTAGKPLQKKGVFFVGLPVVPMKIVSLAQGILGFVYPFILGIILDKLTIFPEARGEISLQIGNSILGRGGMFTLRVKRKKFPKFFNCQRIISGIIEAHCFLILKVGKVLGINWGGSKVNKNKRDKQNVKFPDHDIQK
jgi:hypothetical protein